jgi:hypothetical protein
VAPMNRVSGKVRIACAVDLHTRKRLKSQWITNVYLGALRATSSVDGWDESEKRHPSAS